MHCRFGYQPVRSESDDSYTQFYAVMRYFSMPALACYSSNQILSEHSVGLELFDGSALESW